VSRDPRTSHAAVRDARALDARANPEDSRSSGTANGYRAASTAKAVTATRQGRRRRDQIWRRQWRWSASPSCSADLRWSRQSGPRPHAWRRTCPLGRVLIGKQRPALEWMWKGRRDACPGQRSRDSRRHRGRGTATPMRGARATAPASVVVGGRGDADGGRSSRRRTGAATTAARAPRGSLSPWRRGKLGAAALSAWGRTAPGGRRRRRQRRGVSAGAGARRRRFKISGPLQRRRRIKRGSIGGCLAASARHASSPAPSLSAGAVTPTGGGLPVVRFALRRRQRGLREARFPPGVGGSRGPQRPRRGGAPPLACGGGGRNDGVLPPARRWGAAAPLQDVRSSAAAPPNQARPNRRPSCRRRATRVFACPRRSRRAR